MRIISGTLKNQQILSPPGLHTRPTSNRLRETLFNICQGFIDKARFLDLFAGSGAIGLEALSRGAEECTFIDHNRGCARCIETNLANMKLGRQGKVLTGDTFTWLERLSKSPQKYTIIYADPPYDAQLDVDGVNITYSQHLLYLIDKSPLLEHGGMLFIEDSKASKPIPKDLSTLKLISERRTGRSTLLQFQCHRS